MDTFYDYFRENMESLGLPAPASLYGNLTTALGTAATISAFVDKYGTRVTVRDLVGAGLRADKLMVAGAVSASFYAGAVVGSLAVATGRSLTGGSSLADVLAYAARMRLDPPWMGRVLAANPAFYRRPRSTQAHAATP